MSKRVANTKAKTARNGRVRLGYWKREKRWRELLARVVEPFTVATQQKPESGWKSFKRIARSLLPARHQTGRNR